MTLLSQKLEELKTRYGDQHGADYALLLDLNARLEQQDKHLIDELLAVLEAQDRRRAEIHRILVMLQARIGGLPPPAIKPLEALPLGASDAIPPQAGLRPDGSPVLAASAPEGYDHGARAVASRFAPPQPNGHYQTSPAGVQ
ncbi:MAG: hypothetical protein AB7S70_02585 [Hyphomicrobium sp.]|uniref:hypothetical protein n=1 Tax=Hyphomicrobium sp. TaxID=82 RepID=UPI003D10E615